MGDGAVYILGVLGMAFGLVCGPGGRGVFVVVHIGIVCRELVDNKDL